MDNSTLRFAVQVGVALIAAYTAWEARKKKQRLEALAESQMSHETPLRAAIESEEPTGISKLFATVTKQGDAYKLEIRRDNDNGPITVDQTFSNLDALETYLSEKTVFRFGDFVAR